MARRTPTNGNQLGFGTLLVEDTLAELAKLEAAEAAELAIVRPRWSGVCYEPGGFNVPLRVADTIAELRDFAAEAFSANPCIRYVDVTAPSGDWTDRIFPTPAAGRSTHRKAA
jgi:hypothetical protein